MRHTSRRRKLVLLAIMLLALMVGGAWLVKEPWHTGPYPLGNQLGGKAPASEHFNPERAYQDVQYQVDLGPRIPGSEAHAQVSDWMASELRAAGWVVEVQETTRMDHPLRNVIARWGTGQPWVVLGAHYDSRMVADQDPNPDNRSLPVPGANDGASGVAVLLEMARLLPQQFDPGDIQVWLVFFDLEDQGKLPGWDWILGSQAFVESLQAKPDAAVIVDMIGDRDLNIYQEKSSNQALNAQIWEQAARLGYAEQFIAQPGYSILDDHTPFLRAGIPAADLIDFDYPYWHTVEDTADKVAPESLQAVGETLLAWLHSLVQ